MSDVESKDRRAVGAEKQKINAGGKPNQRGGNGSGGGGGSGRNDN